MPVLTEVWSKVATLHLRGPAQPSGEVNNKEEKRRPTGRLLRLDKLNQSLGGSKKVSSVTRIFSIELYENEVQSFV